MKTTTLSIALAAALFAGASGAVKAHDLQPLIDRASQGDSAAMVQAGEALLARDRAIEGLMYLENVVRLGRPEEDVARAHAALGDHYSRITSNPVASQTSLTHYQQAAILGHVPSQVRLGQIYLHNARNQRGKEREATLDRALVVLEHAAAAASDPEAAFVLGNAFLKGDVFKKNDAVGTAWLAVAADRGHLEAAMIVGQHQLHAGEQVAAIRYLGQAARAGRGEAMMLLANAYADGSKLPHDKDLAKLWAEEARAAGMVEASSLLARLSPPPPPPAPVAPEPTRVASSQLAPMPGAFEPGPLPAVQVAAVQAPTASQVETDRLHELEARNAQLMKMVEQLTSQVEHLAAGRQAPTNQMRQEEVDGRVAFQGEAAPTTDREAVAQATSTAPAPIPVVEVAQVPVEASSPTSRRAPKLSQNERGMQEHAQGNFVQASRHFNRGSRSGDADAMNNLGMLYLQGQGVAMDQGRAMELFRQAAEKGHMVAARNIGYMYQQGMGVRQDLARATVWLRHAGSLERRQLQGSNYAGI